MADIIQFPRRVRVPQLGICLAPSDSMSPTIMADDIVEIDESCRTIEGDAIFVVEIAGKPAIRRVQRLHGRLRISIDSAPEAAELVDAAALRVLGRVTRTWAQRKA